jgi:hypothetical protein
MDERAVFLRFELFAKRLTKLISMFTTVHQFGSLERHTHIAGMGSPLSGACSQSDAMPVPVLLVGLRPSS